MKMNGVKFFQKGIKYLIKIDVQYNVRCFATTSMALVVMLVSGSIPNPENKRQMRSKILRVFSGIYALLSRISIFNTVRLIRC